MALVRDIIFKPPPQLMELVSNEIKAFNLKIAKRITIKFDPFRKDVSDIRKFCHLIHCNEGRISNPKLLIKTEILIDRSEHSIIFNLIDNQKFIFKCENLKLLEICKLINEHITPLSPAEEVVEDRPKIKKKKKK